MHAVCCVCYTLYYPAHNGGAVSWPHVAQLDQLHHNTTHADDAGVGGVMCDKQLYLVSSYRCCYHISPSTLDIPQYWTRLVRGCTLDN